MMNFMTPALILSTNTMGEVYHSTGRGHWCHQSQTLLNCPSYMGITRSTLPQTNGNLPLSFLCVIRPVVTLDNIINGCIFILTGSPG